MSESISEITCKPCSGEDACLAAFLPKGLTFDKGILSGTPEEDVHDGIVYIYDGTSSFKLRVNSERIMLYYL